MKVAEHDNVTVSVQNPPVDPVTPEPAAEPAVVETLENRQMMSVSLHKGHMGVSGFTNQSNTIQIAVKGDHVHAMVNGQNEGTFKLADVKSIHIVGGDKNDYIEVDAGVRVPVHIQGLDGDDRLIGGSGKDVIEGGNGNDTIYGGAGADVINGNGGNDRIYGGEGGDAIAGSKGSDIMYGEDGNDRFIMVQNIDKVIGGAGRDEMTIDPVRVDVSQPSAGTTAPKAPAKTIKGPYVHSLSLIDASTGKPVEGYSELKSGVVLNLAELPKNLNIAANLAGGSSKVRFDYDGKANYRIESNAPYALGGDEAGKFSSMKFTTGQHTLTAATVDGNTVLHALGIKFKVINQPKVSNNTPSTTPAPTPAPAPTPSKDATAPEAHINAISTTVPAGHAIHVDALATKLGAGNWHEADYVWDFGDKGSAYNTLKGFSAAHSYAKAGTYTIKLTVTNKLGKTDDVTIKVNVTPAARKVIYVSSDGSDSNSGTSSSSPIKTIQRAMQLLDNNTEILFRRGDKFTMNQTFQIPYTNVLIGAYGIGEKPKIVWNGKRDSSNMFATTSKSRDVTVQDLSLDSIFTSDTNDNGAPIGMRPIGTNITFQRNTVLNLMHGANLNARPDGFLFLGNDAPLKTGLRKYFVWAEGEHVTIVGNSAANSTREHIVRANYVSKINVSHNSFTNLDLTATDKYDIKKTALNMQSGEFAYMGNNQLGAAWHIGPLGKETGVEDVSRRFKYAIGEFNEIADTTMEVQHGAEYIMIRNNVFHNDGITAISVDGYSSAPYNRGVKDLIVMNNTALNDATRGVFLRVWGAVDGIRLINNLYVAPNLTIGSYETAAVRVDEGHLNSFTEINGNVWPTAKRTLDWVGEQAMFFLGKNYGSVSGFQTLDEWNAKPVVGDDIQTNVQLSGSYSIVIRPGQTVGAKLAA